jgi:hypothetical protein
VTAARFVAVVAFALTMAGCGAPWAQRAAVAGDVAAQTWLAARGVPCLDMPAAPPVATTRAPTVDEVVAVMAWAAELKRQADAVQRAGTEELAAKASAMPEPLPTVAPKD